MNSSVKTLDVTILDREFRVACPEDEQKGLLEAVDYLNQKMNEIRDNGKIIGLERIAIMAALNITHEFLTTRVGGFDVGEFKRRITSMNNQIEQSMADKNDLFK